MIIPARLYQGTLTNANATLYTAPSSYQGRTVLQVIVKQVFICNITGSPATINLGIVPGGGGLGSGNELFANAGYAANTGTPVNLAQVMLPTDVLAGGANVNSAITLTISGYYHV